MIVRQHIPSFWEAEGSQVELTSLEELLRQKFVKCFQETASFERFSIERDYYPGYGLALLMAEFRKSPYWWVVAHLEGDITPLAELPDFEPKKPDDMK